MRRLHRLVPCAWAFASLALVLPQAGSAGELSPQAVRFAPGYEATFKEAYGAREVPALRAKVADAVSQRLESAGSACSLRLDVTIDRAAPTHPTVQQQMDNPSLSPVGTVFRDSGASLTGHVLDSRGHVLDTVKYQYFNGYWSLIYPGKDPWSEARIAIDGFSRRLVDACVKQSAAARG
jgi:hypothetical protein